MKRKPDEFNQLPEGFEGEQKRRTEFKSQDEKLVYDAANLIQLAKKRYSKEQVTVHDALDLATRQDDDIEGLKKAIAIQIKNRTGYILYPNLVPLTKRILSPENKEQLLCTLKIRFEANMERHKKIEWAKVEARLNEAAPEKLWSLNEMERTGGEPDVVNFIEETGEYEFFDCSAESPSGRRNICYDYAGQTEAEIRGSKPAGNAVDIAAAMGLGGILSFMQRWELEKFVKSNTKTVSWLLAPEDKRKRGVALAWAEYTDRILEFETTPYVCENNRAFRGWLRI